MDEAAINTRVQNHPGILIVRQDEAGRAETVLSWADKARAYTIEVDKYLEDDAGRQWLETLARQLAGH